MPQLVKVVIEVLVRLIAAREDARQLARHRIKSISELPLRLELADVVQQPVERLA